MMTHQPRTYGTIRHNRFTHVSVYCSPVCTCVPPLTYLFLLNVTEEPYTGVTSTCLYSSNSIVVHCSRGVMTSLVKCVAYELRFVVATFAPVLLTRVVLVFESKVRPNQHTRALWRTDTVCFRMRSWTVSVLVVAPVSWQGWNLKLMNLRTWIHRGRKESIAYPISS